MAEREIPSPLVDRRFLQNLAYRDPAKLRARQALWSYVEDRPAGGRIRSALELAGDEIIVDVGCGNGVDLSMLRAGGHAGPLIGIDLSEGMVTALSRRVAARVVADATHLPLGSASADVVLAMHMLYHLPDLRAGLAEMRRVLRADGVLVASTNSTRSASELTEAMAEAGVPALDSTHETTFSSENGAEILSQLFESVEVKVQTRTSRVPEARVVRDYVASTGDLHATLLSKPGAWEEVLDRVTAQAQQVIDN